MKFSCILSFKDHDHEDRIFKIGSMSPVFFFDLFIGKNQANYCLDHLLLN